MSRVLEQPLVSVGIPTFNRPEGLRRTLQCITAQTYGNLEIIISDNCSPGEQVGVVANDFLQRDERLSYFRQHTPLSIDNNFRFVLEKAQGDYFMWAADDDEWREEFIASCVGALQARGVVSAMSHFSTLYRFDGRLVKGRMPDLALGNSKLQNALAFLDCITPSFFYGVHKRDEISFFLHEAFFDFYDCYFMLRLILHGKVAIIESELYVAGVDAPDYQVKPVRKYRFTNLKYSTFFYHSVKSVFSSSLNASGKVKVIAKMIYVVVSLFWFHEIKKVLQ